MAKNSGIGGSLWNRISSSDNDVKHLDDKGDYKNNGDETTQGVGGYEARQNASSNVESRLSVGHKFIDQ
jgi:hypothetical protein